MKNQMNTRHEKQNQSSGWAALLIGIGAMAIACQTARAETTVYHANLVLERTTPDLSIWRQAWEIFSAQIIPVVNQAAGGARFGTSYNNDRGVIYLLRDTTSDFNQTYRDFQMIPSMVPANEFFTVRVEGPFRGAAAPPCDLTLNGRGDGFGSAAQTRRLRGSQRWKSSCMVENTTAQPIICNGYIVGSMTNRRRGCRMIVREQTGWNCYASLRTRRYQTPTVSPYSTFRWYTTIQPIRTTPKRRPVAADLIIAPTSFDSSSIPFVPKFSDKAKFRCIPM